MKKKSLFIKNKKFNYLNTRNKIGMNILFQPSYYYGIEKDRKYIGRV